MATSLTPITGTANVTNGSTTVEVIAPLALSALNCAEGANVSLGRAAYFVGSDGPTDTTHFELEAPYEGTTGTVSISIGQVTPEMTQRITLSKALQSLNTSALLIAANQAGLSYSYTGSTAAPASGQVALDNVDPAAATIIKFAEADLSEQSVVDRLGQIGTGDEITIRAFDGSARLSFVAAGAAVDEGNYQQVAVTYLGAAGVLAASAQVVVERIAKGVKGDAGANGASDFDLVQQVYAQTDLQMAELSSTALLVGMDTGNGVFDGFNDLGYVDVAGATNLNTATDGQLSPTLGAGGSGTSTTPSATTSATSATPSGTTANLSALTVFDRSWTVPNGKTVVSIGVYSTTARTMSVKIVQQTSTGVYKVLGTESFNHPGGGWADHTLATAITTPGTGNCYAGAYYASGTIDINATTARGYNASGDMTGSGNACTEDTGNCLAARVAYLATSNLSALTVFDRSWTVPNGKTVTSIGIYSGAAQTFSVKIVQRTAAGVYTVIGSESFSHPGGGWADHTLTAPINIPATGTYYAAEYQASGNIEYNASTSRGFNTAGGDMAGSGVACTENSGNCPGLRVTCAGTPNAMTVESQTINLSGVPTWARLLAFVTQNDASVNSDLVFSVSRDGSAFDNLTMNELFTRQDGSICVDSGRVDITGIASGTAGKWKAVTANSKNPYLLAVAAIFGT
jgi:hypothetical protein